MDSTRKQDGQLDPEENFDQELEKVMSKEKPDKKKSIKDHLMTRCTMDDNVLVKKVVASIKVIDCHHELIDPDFSKAYNRFSFKIVKAMRERNCIAKNMICSPFSITACIAMSMLGARDKTETEIKEMLGFGAIDIHIPFGKLIDCYVLVMNYSNQIRFNFINKMYIQKNNDSPSISENYKQELSRSYGASIEEADFESNGKELLDKLNAWISKQTSQKIVKIFDEPLPSSTQMLLLNVVYFKGKWLESFDVNLTKNVSFYNYGDVTKPVEVPMMHKQKTRYRYAELSLERCYLQIVEIPYAGDLSMTLIVPREMDGITELTNCFDINRYDEMKAKLMTEQVDLIVPKFSFESTYNMKESVCDLGMKTAFENDANFSGIRTSKGLCLSLAFHKAVIEVDEEGFNSESSSEDLVQTDRMRFVPSIKANHPFIFIVRDTFSSIILFQGKVEHF